VSSTSEVTIRIKGDDDSDSAFRQARNNEERLAASAKAAGISLTLMGQHGAAAGKATGDGADRAREGVKRLNAGIQELDRGMQTLAKEFERTGDVDFLRQTKRLGQSKRELEGFKKDLVKILGDDAGEETGRSFTGRFLDKLSSGFSGDLGELPSKLKGALIVTVAGAAIAAAPALGAAVSAAVLGGVGVGGIAGGVALAFKDPAVSEAAKNMGSEFGSNVAGSAMDAFKGPTLAAIGILGDELTKQEPRITRIFQRLAPLTSDIAHGVAEGIDKLGPALERTFTRAGPVVEEISKDIPIIADGVGEFLDKVSSGGPGAVQFMHDFADGTHNLLSGIGSLIDGLSHLYDFARNSPFSPILFAAPANALMDLTGSTEKATFGLKALDAAHLVAAQSAKIHADQINQLRLGADLASEDFTKLSGQISATAQTTDVLAGQMADKLLNATMSLDQATLGFAESQTRLTQSIADNGRQLDIHTEKGQANREAILGVVAANIRQYDTLIASGVSAQDAAAAYDQNTGSLIKQMQQAHFTSGQINDLIGKYMAVPDRVNTDIALQGVGKAIADLDDTLRAINHLPSRKVINVDVVTSQVGSLGASVGGRIRGANAQGGTVGSAGGGWGYAAAGGNRNGLTMVGERGFELADLSAGSRVYSHQDSMRMVADMARGGGGGGGGTQVLEVRPAPGFDSAIMRVFLEMIETALRTDPAFAGAIAAAGT
jgi:hypothetical protein